MKIQAKAQKLRRYVKRRKQFRQNQMFANKRKNSLETLVKNRHQLKNHQKEATETFRRSILKNSAEMKN